MILTETEEMLVIILGAFMFMAIIGKTIKEKDIAYVKKLKEVVDLKNEKLQKQIKEQDKA